MAKADIDYTKLDTQLFAAVNRTSQAAFNNASFEVFIRAKTPIQPGAYLDQNNQVIPGVTIRGTKASLIQTGIASGAALGPLSKDPNVMYIRGSTKMGPI